MPDAPAGDALRAAEHDLDEAVIHLPDQDWAAYARARNSLVAAARAEEREACAKLCDAEQDHAEESREGSAAYAWWNGRADSAAVLALRIRARWPSSGTDQTKRGDEG